jgi:hypothetical protein
MLTRRRDLTMISDVTYRIARTLRAVGTGAVLVLGACSTDDILDVDRPDIIDPSKLGGALGATALYNGAIGDVAYAQGTFAGVMIASGLFSDEFRFGGTPPEVRQFDLGFILRENSFSQPIYLNIHRARVGTQKAADALRKVDPSDKRIGEILALSAMATIWIGEHYCSGAPLSDYGPPETYASPSSTADIFNAAITLLTTAGTTTGADPRIVNLIAVLRGRALLNNGQFAAAAAAVANVPTTFRYETLYSSADTRTQNTMKAFIYDFDYLSVSDGEGGNGLNFATANDPRVPAVLSPLTPGGVSRFDGKTPHYQLTTYSSFDSPIVNVSGVEARLIEAEAALQGTTPNVGLWIQKLNDARAPWSLGPVTDPGTPSGRVDLMFRERAFALFATAHRVGDLRRLVRQYGRSVTQVFPTGPYHKDNLTRGNQGSIPVPQTEDNNPNYDASACDPLKA